MGGFRKAIKRRIIGLVCLDFVILLLVVFAAIYGNKISGAIGDFIRGFQTGIFFALQLPILFLIFRYVRVVHNEQRLKQLYIEENDERAKLIRDKIGGVGFFFSLVMIGAATVAAGFFNHIVFFTLFGVMVFMVMVLACLKLYYRNKY